ncbi:MAG: polysaccharide biosynthesis [Prolixibacteraceae bacterium]|nr:MAG: polysaccharide biosynthesis [Prolixibacteraceae bacterium]
MGTYKKLAADTAIYGLSSILGRVLNWLLTPYYSFIFLTGEFGVMTNLYSYVAILLVILTYGMETSFFRFASKSDNPVRIYSTTMISVFSTSVLFLLVFILLKNPLAQLIQYPQHPEYIVWFAIILAIDAFTAIPFAWIRIENKPMKFAIIKLVNIAFNIGFNLFFLTFCPWILKNNPGSVIGLIYSPAIGVGYVFISNLLASLITLFMLMPDILKVSLRFDKAVLKQMCYYGFPVLIVGIAGMLSQGIDKILIPFLLPESQKPMEQLGIYGANFKMAVLMNMFIQAFRYAFEPFFFARGNSKEDPVVYARVMNYFVIFGLFIFLGMTMYIDVLKIIINEQYHSGLKVVPIILMANLIYGMYYTQSLWYKVTDKTKYGAYQSIIEAIVAITLNILLIPIYGYMGSAAALFTSYIVVLTISYFLGQKYYPVPYNLKKIAVYFVIALVLYVASKLVETSQSLVNYAVGTLFIGIFTAAVFTIEKNELKSLFKFSKKK